MSTNTTVNYAPVALDATGKGIEPKYSAASENMSAKVVDQADSGEINFGTDTEEFQLDLEPIAFARGTYSVHAEVLLSVPDFYESAFSKKHPWQQTQTNFGTTLGVSGHYRSLFSTKGNYRNFYEIFAMSNAKSFFQSQSVPSFYSDDGNCSETTYHPPIKGKDYESYKPFAVESRGYTRAYFYGVSK